jgi:hypothetical protein
MFPVMLAFIVLLLAKGANQTYTLTDNQPVGNFITSIEFGKDIPAANNQLVAAGDSNSDIIFFDLDVGTGAMTLDSTWNLNALASSGSFGFYICVN